MLTGIALPPLFYEVAMGIFEMMRNPNEVQVPVGISGFLSKAGEIGFCMDGATHMIHSPTGATRLKARNENADDQLRHYEDGTTMVTVMGFQVLGPECTYVFVYNVQPTEQAIKLAGPIDSWPWKR